MKVSYNKLMIIIAILVIITLITYLIIESRVSFKLKGESKVTVSYGSVYNDEGFIFQMEGKDLSKYVLVNDSIDYGKLGKYKITYKASYNSYEKIITRTVFIIDDKGPNIALNGDNPLYIKYGGNYKEEGYSVNDNYDLEEDIEVKVSYSSEIDTKKPGIYKVTYKAKDKSGNITEIIRDVIVQNKVLNINGITYVDGILIVNKKYSLPKNYNPGVNEEALKQLVKMQNDASKLGYDLKLCSSFRTYEYQDNLYNRYVKEFGQEVTDTFSAKAGHSEHQTGLAFDVGKIEDSFGDTKDGQWLEKNAHKYGFIIRYPKDKQEITGYKYEPWHIRYLGISNATKVYESGLTLEEYLIIN